MYGDTHESAICCCALARATAISIRSLRSLTHHASGITHLLGLPLFVFSPPRLRSFACGLPVLTTIRATSYSTAAKSWRRQGDGQGEELTLTRSRRWRGAGVGEELALARSWRHLTASLLLLLACSPVLSLSARLACASRLIVLPHSCSTGLANSLRQLVCTSSSAPARLSCSACLGRVGRCLSPARASPCHLAMPLRLATSTLHVASPTHLARLQLECRPAVAPGVGVGARLPTYAEVTKRRVGTSLLGFLFSRTLLFK